MTLVKLMGLDEPIWLMIWLVLAVCIAAVYFKAWWKRP